MLRGQRHRGVDRRERKCGSQSGHPGRGQDRRLPQARLPSLASSSGWVREATAVALTRTGVLGITVYLLSFGFSEEPSPRIARGHSRTGQCLLGPLDAELTVLLSVRGLWGSRPGGPPPPPPLPPAHQGHQDQGQRQAQQRGGAEEQRGERQRGLGVRGGPGSHRLLRLQRGPGRQAARPSCWRRRGRGGRAGGRGEGRPVREGVGGGEAGAWRVGSGASMGKGRQGAVRGTR